MGRHGPLYNTVMRDSDSDCSSNQERRFAGSPKNITFQDKGLEEEANKYPERHLGKTLAIAPDTNITVIAVAGYTLRKAFAMMQTDKDVREDGDSPRLWYKDPQHYQISWISCISNHCRYHIQDKAANNLFPRRFGKEPQVQQYEACELEHWKVSRFYREENYAIMKLDPQIPLTCLRNPYTWAKCATSLCALHMQEKAIAWHQQFGSPESDSETESENPENNSEDRQITTFQGKGKGRS